MNPGHALRQAMRDVPVTKAEPNDREPKLRLYEDYASDAQNEALTPNNGGRISGNMLKFDQEDPAQGIFFIAADGTETRAVQVMVNAPRRLVFLAPGSYTLIVRALFGNKRRNGSLEALQTVA